MKASEDLMKHDDSSVGVNKASSPGGLILWKSARSAGEDSICVCWGWGGLKLKPMRPWQSCMQTQSATLTQLDITMHNLCF